MSQMDNIIILILTLLGAKNSAGPVHKSLKYERELSIYKPLLIT